MNLFIKNIALLILCVSSIQLAKQNTLAKQDTVNNHNLQEWIVLQDETYAFLNEDLSLKMESYEYKYNEKIHGVLLEDKSKPIRSWIVKFKNGEDVLFFPFPFLVQNTTAHYHENDFKIGKEKVDIFFPLPVNYKPVDLEKISQKWNFHGEEYPKFLRKMAHDALIQLMNAAANNNIHLKVVSAFRSFEKQRILYLKAIFNKGIYQIGTAKPGHSEHQLGTTVDLTSLNRADMLSSSFNKTPEGQWLKNNAHKFGFVQSYTEENAEEKGYKPEPWHFRYMGYTAK